MSTAALSLTDLFRADVRTSREADDLNSRLQSALGLDYRYQVARLAIAASLGEHAPPSPAPDLLGKPIRGETLFGQEEADLALWTALLVQHGASVLVTRKAVLDRAAAHWHRGVHRLRRQWGKYEGRPEDFLLRLGLSHATPPRVEQTAKSA